MNTEFIRAGANTLSSTKDLKAASTCSVYPAPGHGGSGLGIHLTNTVDGNILIGPSNEYIDQPRRLFLNCRNYRAA